MKETKTTRSTYAAMGMNRHDYEACLNFDSEWNFFTLHCHDFYEFYIHISGAQYYSIDDQVYPIGPYTLMVVPPFRIHGLLSDHPLQDYERCFLYISPAMLKECGGSRIELDQFFSQHIQDGNYQYRMTEQEGLTCKRLMQELKETQEDRSSLTSFYNYTKLLEYLSIICQVLHRSHELVKPIVINVAMQEVLGYVNEHFTMPIKLDELARKFGVSTSFLSHEFVKYTGRSVYDYVLFRRILLAKQIIVSPLSLNEIAFQCGFSDYSSFLRTFTKMTGMSPSAYRKSVQKTR